eukprot:330416-Pyramimonas_sp.AAC.1
MLVFSAERQCAGRFHGAAQRQEGPTQVAPDGEHYAIMMASQLVHGSHALKSDCRGSALCCHRLGAAAGPGNVRAHLWSRTALSKAFQRATVSHIKAHTTMD